MESRLDTGNMKILHLLTSLTFGIAVLTVAPAQGDPTKAIAAYYAKDDALALKADYAGLKKLKLENSTSDFVSVVKAGKTGKTITRTRADEFAQLDGFSKIIDSIVKSNSHIDRITQGKKAIVVTVTSSGELKTKKLPQDGKVHRLANTGTSEDTWVKVGGAWKIKQSKSLTSKMLLDGKPLPGM
jgi:hypothetical protein